MCIVFHFCCSPNIVCKPSSISWPDIVLPFHLSVFLLICIIVLCVTLCLLHIIGAIQKGSDLVL